MNNIIYIIWGFLGLIGWFFTYNTLRKYWYIKLHKNNINFTLYMFSIMDIRWIVVNYILGNVL